jgi:glycosyltransferase involved in cell wall biosynthesis
VSHKTLPRKQYVTSGSEDIAGRIAAGKSTHVAGKRLLHLINGRFGAQRMTGVQRVAFGLVRGLDVLPGLPGRWQLLSPAGVSWGPLQQLELVVRGRGLGQGHVWEQCVAGSAAGRHALLLNIAGSGPWYGHRQVSWLHDAAVFDHPQAYRPAFVAWYRALFRRRAERGDLLVTPSRASLMQLTRHLGVGEDRFLVLPNGCDHLDAVAGDPAVLSRFGLATQGFWLCVASHNPNKNLQRLLQAHALLPAPRQPLVMVGGSDSAVFARLARSAAETAADVRWVQADDAALKALLQSALGLVLPSLTEGFGLPAAEAQRLGCPVIASDIAALRETCGDAALFVDPVRADSIAHAMARLGTDADMRASLSAAGRAHASGRTWRAAAVALALRLQHPR